jgi:predicted amidophosphoribosyltransferase
VTCHSRIRRTFKKAKADSIEVHHAEFRPDGIGPVCGGTLTLSVRATIDDGCSCCGTAVVVVEVECSRCKHGSFPNMEKLTSSFSVCDELARLATNGIRVDQINEELEALHRKPVSQRLKEMHEREKERENQ